ncbi:MAG: NAD(P)/FAD-dependent oxidoreductase [Alkalispirochaeta sp.]
MQNNTQEIFDVAVIGAGAIGAGIAYELSKLDVGVAIIEKAAIPVQGTTKGNSGVLHAGYDDPEGTLREELVVKGNRRYDDWAAELGVSVVRNGSMVVAMNDEDMDYIRKLYERGTARNVEGLELLSGVETRALEPNLNPAVQGALRAKTAGVVCPMTVVNMLFKNIVANGVTPFMGREVIGFDFEDPDTIGVVTSNGTIRARTVVNAAGVHGDEVSAMAGIDQYRITPRKGEYILLEPHPDYNVDHVIFPTPAKNSKGALVIRTATGDVLLGPTADDLPKEEQDNTATTPEGLQEGLEKTRRLVPGVRTELTVKTYAGNRAEPDTKDFIIERYREPAGFINAIGIRSPGLTAAPAIADRVVGLVQEVIGPRKRRDDYQQVRFAVYEPWEEAKEDIRWADTLTPNLDAPPRVLLDHAWKFGVGSQLYQYNCFADRGLGVDLGTTFQNEMITYLQEKGVPLEQTVYRANQPPQVIPK